ncbi:hypothetical protein ACFQLX_25120 [Streptomyces polyrhachis]|uniref:Uncharacterized protein n=1 Tax=Streptomyces polyrhachis TaxID=1282885 RepID=A0ABW2GQT6_9ACTN
MIRNRIVSFIATFSLAGALGGAVALAAGAAPAVAPGHERQTTPARISDAEPAVKQAPKSQPDTDPGTYGNDE